MSYCRQPYYIYPNINGTVCFDIFGGIPDEVVNVFLYKLYNFRNDEFIERTELGRKALDEWEESKDNDSPFKTIQDISNKYLKTIEDEELAEEKLSKTTNYKINKNSKMTKEEYEKWINDNIEDIVELETNTECDTFEEQWFGDDKNE